MTRLQADVAAVWPPVPQRDTGGPVGTKGATRQRSRTRAAATGQLGACAQNATRTDARILAFSSHKGALLGSRTSGQSPKTQKFSTNAE